MKKFKKIISIGCAAIMAVSIMSVSAFAKTEIPLENGAVLTIYEDDENYPVAGRRTANFGFSQLFSAYSDFDYVQTPYTVNGVNNVIPLSSSESSIRISFTAKPTTFYMALYDTTTGSYMTSGTNGLMLMQNTSSRYTISNLPSGHAYSLRFAGSGQKGRISGTIETY